MSTQGKVGISSGGALASNLSRLEALLQPYATSGLPHLIDGASTPSEGGATFETRSPVDDSLIANVARGTAADVDRAAHAAARAFGPWRDLSAGRRREILLAVAGAIAERAEEIALLESWDTGQALKFMSKAALRGAENFRFFAERAEGARDGLSLPTETHLNYTLRTPIGPVGVITPWNTPFMLSTWKIAPALAAGCTVVHKPAEWSPVTALRLAQIALQAGLPPGVLNVVHGLGEEAGKALTEHPAIKAVAFIGESSTGSAIMRQGAATLKRVHFELGGKNPVIVFDDADLDRALDAVVFMIYSLNGERCTSSSRLLVQRSIAGPFLERLAARVRALKVGHPLDPAHRGRPTHPFTPPRQGAVVLRHRPRRRRAGAGGRHPFAGPGGGHYVSPTLLTDAKPTMRIAQEEIFGPVLTCLAFEDEAEALALANNVRYGLAGYVWTRDVTRALRVSERLEAGMVWVNSENVRHLPTPFGGMKDSGIGRDGGDYSFDFYMETRNIALALGNHAIARLGAV